MERLTSQLEDVGHGVAIAGDGQAGLLIGTKRLLVLDHCSHSSTLAWKPSMEFEPCTARAKVARRSVPYQRLGSWR